MKNEKLKFSLLLEMKDYKDYNMWVNRKKVLKIALVYFVLLFSILFFGNIVHINEVYSRIEICAIASMIVSIIFVLAFYIGIGYKSKKVFRTDDLLRHVQKYTIDDNGISSKSEIGEGKVNWSDVVKVDKNKKGMYIFISRNEAIIIPYRIFKNTEDIELLNSIVTSNIKK